MDAFINVGTILLTIGFMIVFATILSMKIGKLGEPTGDAVVDWFWTVLNTVSITALVLGAVLGFAYAMEMDNTLLAGIGAIVTGAGIWVACRLFGNRLREVPAAPVSAEKPVSPIKRPSLMQHFQIFPTGYRFEEPGARPKRDKIR